MYLSTSAKQLPILVIVIALIHELVLSFSILPDPLGVVPERLVLRFFMWSVIIAIHLFIIHVHQVILVHTLIMPGVMPLGHWDKSGRLSYRHSPPPSSAN